MPSENWKEESTQINEIVDSFGVPLALEIEESKPKTSSSDRVKESKSQRVKESKSQSQSRDLPFAICISGRGWNQSAARSAVKPAKKRIQKGDRKHRKVCDLEFASENQRVFLVFLSFPSAKI